MFSDTLPWPWHRRRGESVQACRAFEVYLHGAIMGRRSIRRTAAALGVSRQLLERWSVRWSWVARAAAYDRAVDRLRIARRLAEVEADALRKAHEEHERRMEPFRRDLVAAGHFLGLDDLIELVAGEESMLGERGAETRPETVDGDTRGWAKERKLERSVV